MINFKANNKEYNEIKGKYQFKSPYHKNNRMLPFNVLSSTSPDKDYPIQVYTVEYRGSKKIDHYGNYKEAVIMEMIESGFLTKA